MGQADRLRRARRYALALTDTFLPAAFLTTLRRLRCKGSRMANVEDFAPDRDPTAIRAGPFGSQLLNNPNYVPIGIRRLDDGERR